MRCENAGSTESSEDYLEAIFVIRAERGFCRNADIAERLGVTRPSVTKALAGLSSRSLVEVAGRDVRAITGQQPMITRARKSIATFRLRAGMPIGCKVTLRGDRMWEFFDRLTSVAIPRIRDFRGISAKSFDGRGNFSMGVTEQLIFPEIDFDSVDHQRGMDITFVTTANTDEEAKALLDAFGFPFKK